MRKLLRSIARHNLIRAGAVHINRKQSGGSKFARVWHDNVHYAKLVSGLNRKGVKVRT